VERRSAAQESPSAARRYLFRGYALDADTLELRDEAGKLVELPPSAFDLILCLLRNRSRVVSKEELLQALWPGVFVNENALSQCVWAARRAVGDGGRDQYVIKNVRGRGYRFVADAQEVTSRLDAVAGAPTDAAPSSPGSGLAFFGREREIERLERALDAVAAGRGQIRLLMGDGGIGKTRLAQEIAARAGARGFDVIDARADDDAGMPPFWPWKQVLRGFVESTSSDTALALAGEGTAALATLMPELKRRFERAASAPGSEGDERYDLFQSLSDFLRMSSERRPLWITLDDLHWADPSTMQALRFVAQSLERARVGIVVTLREHEIEPAGAKIVARLERLAWTERLEVRGLPRSSVAELLQSTGLVMTDEAVDRVSTLTAGNPLFVLQLAPRFSRGGADDVEERGELLPTAILDALKRRVEGFGTRTETVLRLSALLGQTFRLSDLRRASKLETNELLCVLEELGGRNIAHEIAGQQGVYAFAHPLIRGAVHRAISASERGELEKTLAEAIEESCSQWPETRLDELAHHYFEAAKAGVADRACLYNRLAAKRALESFAFEEATRYYRRALVALDLLDAPDEGERCELLLGLGHALRGAGTDGREVRAVFQEVADRADAARDSELFADAALAFAGGGPLRLGPLTELGMVDAVEVSLLGSAVQRLGTEDSERKALVLSWLARSLYHSSETARRTQASDEAVAVARRLGSEQLVALTLFHRQQVNRAPHDLTSRIADLTEIVEITGRSASRELEFEARCERAWAYTQVASIGEADRDIQVARRIADELRQPRYRRALETWDLAHAYLDEHVDTVLARDYERTNPRRDERTNQAFGLRLMMARFLQDRAGETLDLSERYTEDLPLPMSWRCGLCSTYSIIGRTEDARRIFDQLALTDFAGAPMTHDWLSCYVLLTTACRQLQDSKRAPILREILLPFEGNVLVMGLGTFIGTVVAYQIGELHALSGEPVLAERAYERGLDIAHRLRAPTFIAYGKVCLAEVLASRRRGPDLAAARGLLAEAEALIERTGFAFLKRRVAAVLAR
jgi:DNA-binding winged helix-turn-helix (wHTH) protein